MSKMLKALEKARFEKEFKYSKIDEIKSLKNNKLNIKNCLNYLNDISAEVKSGLAIFITFIVLTTIFLSTSASQAKQTNIPTIQETAMAEISEKNAAEISNINEQLKNINKLTETKQNDLDQISTNYSELTLIIKDLSSTNEAMLDKLIELNDEIENLKENINNKN